MATRRSGGRDTHTRHIGAFENTTSDAATKATTQKAYSDPANRRVGTGLTAARMHLQRSRPDRSVLDVQRVAERLEGCFLESFALGRMRMDRAGDILQPRAHLDG